MEDAEVKLDKRQKLVLRLAQKLKEGADITMTEEKYEASTLRESFTYDEILDIEVEARAALYRGRAELTDDAAAASAKSFADADTSELVPATVLAKLAKWIGRILHPRELEAYNAKLRSQKSGPLTPEDIAFVAAVHRDSVTNNWALDLDAGASPYARIAKASAEFGPKGLDNRQIAAALHILVYLKFTVMKHKHVRNLHDTKASRCAMWALTHQSDWDRFFTR